MRLIASIKEAVYYCNFPSSQSEADFFPSQCQDFLAVWQKLDALLLTKRWMLLRLEAHHDNWKVFVVTHEPEKDQPGIILQLCHWTGGHGMACAHMDEFPPASEQDVSIQTNYWEWSWTSAKPRTMQGCSGSCRLLWAKKSLKDKFKTSLSQC